MARLLALGNPKIKTLKLEDVVDDAPWQRLEKSALLSRAHRKREKITRARPYEWFAGALSDAEIIIIDLHVAVIAAFGQDHV